MPEVVGDEPLLLEALRAGDDAGSTDIVAAATAAVGARPASPGSGRSGRAVLARAAATANAQLGKLLYLTEHLLAILYTHLRLCLPAPALGAASPDKGMLAVAANGGAAAEGGPTLAALGTERVSLVAVVVRDCWHGIVSFHRMCSHARAAACPVSLWSVANACLTAHLLPMLAHYWSSVCPTRPRTLSPLFAGPGPAAPPDGARCHAPGGNHSLPVPDSRPPRCSLAAAAGAANQGVPQHAVSAPSVCSKSRSCCPWLWYPLPFCVTPSYPKWLPKSVS